MNFRFSLLTLIGLTTLAGLGCAALVKPSDTWLSIVVSLTAAAIIVQVLRAILCEGQQRAAALGWLMFAIAYLALTIGPWLDTNVGPRLLTSQAISKAQQKWPEALNPPQESPAPMLRVMGDFDVNDGNLSMSWTQASNSLLVYHLSSGLAYQPPVPNYFQLSAHWLFAWIAGWFGAVLATFFAAAADEVMRDE